MWKIVLIVQLIFIDALFPFSANINAFEIEFLKCQFLDDAAKGDFVFLDIFVGSKLACGTKCTEHLDQCFSYAWDAKTKRCLLYNKRCSSTTIATNSETYWDEYAVRGRKFIKSNSTCSTCSLFQELNSIAVFQLSIYSLLWLVEIAWCEKRYWIKNNCMALQYRRCCQFS